jgi:hypothetical protein
MDVRDLHCILGPLGNDQRLALVDVERLVRIYCQRVRQGRNALAEGAAAVSHILARMAFGRHGYDFTREQWVAIATWAAQVIKESGDAAPTSLNTEACFGPAAVVAAGEPPPHRLTSTTEA